MVLQVGEVWSKTIEDVQRRFGDYLLPAAAFGFLPALVAVRLFDATRVGETGAAGAQFVASLIGIIGQAAIVVLALRPTTDVGSAIREAAAAFPRILGATLLVALSALPLVALVQGGGAAPSPGLALATAVLALGFIFVAVRMALLLPVILAEGSGSVAALQRSWALTAAHFWRILALVLVLLLILVIVSAIAGAVGLLVGGGTAENPGFVSELFVAIIGAVFSIFIGVAIAEIYRRLAG